MKKFNLLAVIICFCFSFNTTAQLKLPNGSQKAKVSQRVGITDITVKYSRPSVKGRDIWGNLVPYGYNNLGFGTATEAPWRAGADENTTITFTHDVKVEGQAVKAGTYGLFVAVFADGKATIILSNDTGAWGSFFYDKSQDAMRADVITKTVAHKELLTYEFNTVTPNSATVSLIWEKKEIPFTIEVPVSTIVLDEFKKTNTGQLGFNRQNWENMAAYALNNGGDLEEALGCLEDKVRSLSSILKIQILLEMDFLL